MKKIFILFLSALSAVSFGSCEIEDDSTGDFNYVTFESDEKNLTVIQGESSSTDITVYTSTVVGRDRTFAINVNSSSSLSADNYTLPESVTIPANTNEGTFNVNVADVTLPDAGGTLVLELERSEEFYTGNSLEIVVSKICPFNSEAYVGSIEVVSDVWGDFAPGEELVIEEGSNENQILIRVTGNPYIVNDDTAYLIVNVNPDSGNVTFQGNEPWNYADFGYEATLSGTGSISLCTGEINLAITYSIPAYDYEETFPLVLQKN